MKQNRMLGMVLCLVLLIMVGCTTTYSKIDTLANGQVIKTESTYQKDWWSILGEPDVMKLKRELVTIAGAVVSTKTCTHEPTSPSILRCTEQ